jgi:hypothetical protein
MTDRSQPSLEERVRRLEAIEEIRHLKALYSRIADEKFTPDHRRKPQDDIDALVRRQAELFTEDGIWDGGPQFGVVQGREAMVEKFRSVPWSFAMHYFGNPVIEVAGDTATGFWMLWEPATLAQGDRAVFMSAVTEDDYVRTPAGWRFKRMRFTLKFITPFDRPWSQGRDAPLGS